MTVLIAGGGIGGLTLALSLHQIGVPVRVFESVPQLRPLGVGINVLPHAVRELVELGLMEQLDASGVRTRELAYFSKRGQPIWSEPRGLDAAICSPLQGRAARSRSACRAWRNTQAPAWRH